VATATQRQTIRAGLFFLVALAGFAGAALWVVGSDWIQGPSTSYSVHIARTGSLVVGDSVVIAGVPVGDVTEMNLNADVPFPVTLKVDLNPRITLHADSTARVVLLDLLGGTALEVIPGSPRAKPLKPGGDIRGIASAGTQALFNRADQLAARTIVLMKHTQQILSTVSQQMPTAVNTLTQFASSAESAADRVEKLTVAFQHVFPKFVKRTDRASTQAVDVLDQAEGASAQLKALSFKLNQALGGQGKRLALLLDQGQAALHEARNATAVVTDNRPLIEQTLQTLSRAAASLKSFSKEIKAHPYSLIRVLPTEDRAPGEPAGAMP
jgi:phospholipid/cholesterol/gamma-HCH transport system substrate-binding protein